jgi:hypothetical protein
VPQPGWWLDLDGPFPLEHPVTIAELTEYQEQIRGVLRELESHHNGSLYFPFFWWGGWQLRPMQYYLNKLPSELVHLFPQLATALVPPPSTPQRNGSVAVLGTDYRDAQVSTSLDGRQPFTVDPAIVE